MDTANVVAVADGWAFEILIERRVGWPMVHDDGDRRWAVMKLSWGGRERVGRGRYVVQASDSG